MVRSASPSVLEAGLVLIPQRSGKVMMVDFNDQYLTSASEDGTVRRTQLHHLAPPLDWSVCGLYATNERVTQHLFTFR